MITSFVCVYTNHAVSLWFICVTYVTYVLYVWVYMSISIVYYVCIHHVRHDYNSCVTYDSFIYVCIQNMLYDYDSYV